MRIFDYPGYEEHKKQHEELIAQFRSYQPRSPRAPQKSASSCCTSSSSGSRSTSSSRTRTTRRTCSSSAPRRSRPVVLVRPPLAPLPRRTRGAPRARGARRLPREPRAGIRRPALSRRLLRPLHSLVAGHRGNLRRARHGPAQAQARLVAARHDARHRRLAGRGHVPRVPRQGARPVRDHAGDVRRLAGSAGADRR